MTFAHLLRNLNMQVIQAPATTPAGYQPSIFIGGGISGCANWQEEFLNYFKTDLPVTFFNPRREGTFSIKDKKQTPIQILWEHKAMAWSDIVVFWFPKETLCPITLFELGKMLVRKKHIFIGCHPKYARRLDVEIQSNLEGKFKIHSSLKSLAQAVNKFITPK